jgi:carbamoyl-phosphate synthase large subunit
MPRREDLKSVLVIGSGPIVIGQGCEFDYSGTQACRVLKQEGIRVSLVNSNPATIMTDPEFADATYVEPITPEVLAKVIAKERPDAVLPTLGGQTALNAAVQLHENGILKKYNVELIGADIDAIEACEDREKFKEIVIGLGAEVPRSTICHSIDECLAAVYGTTPAPARAPDSAGEGRGLGFPVVVRPSFTLGGLGSGIAYNEAGLRRIAGSGLDASPTTEVLLEESIIGWKEFELELMRDRHDNVVIVCSIENVDPMGVHTGDSVTVAPAMTLTDREYQHMRDTAIQIIRAVGVDTGGCNIQFAVNEQRAGVQGHRLPDRQDRHQARDRLHARRDPQRHHRPDPGVLRAGPGLRRRQDPPVRVREVPRCRPHAHHPHEVGRGGDGDRPVLRRGAAEGPAEPGEPDGPVPVH